MFSSIHSQRIRKWIFCPRRYLVNIEVKVGDKYTFKDVEVIARGKQEAFAMAREKVLGEIKVKIKGHRSLGKTKQLDEF